MTQEELLNELKEVPKNLIASAKYYRGMGPEILSTRPESGGWTIMECFEHMNRYDDFYCKALEEAMTESPDVGTDERWFRSGWLGGRSANSMLPKEKMMKMNTFKNMNPEGEELDIESIDRFIKNQRSFLDLIRLARDKDLNKIKVKLTIPMMKFKAGDAFRFILNHGVRHMAQCKRIQASVSE